MPDRSSLSLAWTALAVGGAVAVGLLWVQSRQGPNAQVQWALVDQYCVDCHNDIDLSGELSFEGLAPTDIGAHAETFETAVRKLRGSLMPPPGNPRPETDAVEGLIAWLETELDAADEIPRAGHVPAQRMSRSEYAAVVWDLLAVDIDPAEYLPTDIEIDGFTNMAAALSTSPAFLEQYLSASRSVAHIAVGQAEPKLASSSYPPPEGDQDGHTDGLPLGTRGGTRFIHNFPADGEYRITLTDLEVDVYQRTLETVHTVLVLIDREEVFRAEIGGIDDLMLVNREGATGRAKIMERFAGIPVTVAAGDREVAVTFIERAQSATDTHIHGFVNYGGFSFQGEMRVPRLVGGVQIVGPYEATGVSRTASRDKLFVCEPEVESRERECAERIAAEFARRAYRRPVADDDLAALMPFFDTGRALGGSFDAGIERLVAAVLVSPDFLYRAIAPATSSFSEGAMGEAESGTGVEAPAAAAAAAAAASEYPLSDVELATRLSFFLWGQGPDADLLAIAEAGELGRPEALAREAERMLRDLRAEKLVTEFALSWLDVDDLDEVDPDAALFPQFDEALRDDFATEIELFLASILLEDRNVKELLIAEHTFVNDRLAAHYGIEGIYGPQFRQVQLEDPARRGLLGKAAVLTRTSYGDRTSPVLRGAWILERLMGTPPAPPPPDVETDLSTPEGETPITVRARLEQHREAPNCNGCHGVIDPYGIALENFTVLGEWRDRDRAADADIDALTTLPNGVSIEGPIELRNILLEREDQFVQALTEKLMMYALGREIEYHDMRQVRAIVRASARENYTLASLVQGIVTSDAFRMQALPHEE